MFDESVDAVLKEVCLEIEKRYEIEFVEIGVDKDHVHFLVQSVPTYSLFSSIRNFPSPVPSYRKLDSNLIRS